MYWMEHKQPTLYKKAIMILKSVFNTENLLIHCVLMWNCCLTDARFRGILCFIFVVSFTSGDWHPACCSGFNCFVGLPNNSSTMWYVGSSCYILQYTPPTIHSLYYSFLFCTSLRRIYNSSKNACWKLHFFVVLLILCTVVTQLPVSDRISLFLKG